MGFTRRPIAEYVRKVSQVVPVSDPKEQFLYVDLSSVDKDEKRIVWDAVQQLSWEEAPSRARQIVNAGDILVSTVRPNLNGVAQLEPSCEGAIASTGFCVLRANADVLDPRYLFHWLCSPRFIAEMVKLATGASYPAVSDRIIHESLIPLPSDVLEQRRIAAILDKADAIRKKRREAIELADEFLRSVFLDIFGDPLLDDGRNELLGKLCSIVRGSSPRPQGDPRYFGGTVPRLMVADLTRDGWWVSPQIDSLTTEGAKRSRPVEAGTIVMAVSGNVGVVARLKIDACIHDGFIALTALDATRADPNYLLYCLHLLKASHEKRKAGAIFQNLTTNDIKNMLVPLPSIDQQARFGDVFEKCVAMTNRHIGLASEADALSKSLAQQAFSGQL